MKITLLPEGKPLYYLSVVILAGAVIGLLTAELDTAIGPVIALAAGFLTIAAFNYPQAGVAALVLIIWIEHGLQYYNPAITVSKLIVLLTGISILLKLASGKLKWQPVKITIPLFILLAAMFVSVFYTPSPNSGLLKLIVFLTHITIVFILVEGLRDRYWIKLILIGVTVISFLQALLSFVNIATESVHSGIVRASAGYVDPNVFARGLLTALTISIVLSMLQKGWLWKLGAILVSLTLMGAVFFTGSRSAVLISAILFVFLCLMFLVTQANSWRGFAKLAAMIALIIALNMGAGFMLVKYMPHAYTQRIVNMLGSGLAKTAAKDGRVVLFEAAIDKIAHHPLRGIGIGGYRAKELGVTAIYPHNIFLEIWAENGLAGFIGVCGLLTVPIWVGIRTSYKYRGSPEQLMLMMMALTGYLVSLLYAQLIGQVTSHKPLWIFMGLILALDRSLDVPVLPDTSKREQAPGVTLE